MADNAGSGEGQPNSGGDTNEDDLHSIPDHHDKHLRGFGADRHTDTDFSRAA